ncbi:MAG: transporter [Rhizobiales bacterium]|nr:transporter [Hyphomicrobiales bacterium]
MLKGLDPLLGPELLRVLMAMGHGDEIAIVDGNYPAETDARRLVRMDGHGAPRLLDAILSVMPVDDMVADAVWRPAAFGDSNRMEPVFEDFTAVLLKYEPKQKIVPLIGADFYNKVKACFALVASGEKRLYGNIVVKKGVVYPKRVPPAAPG